MGYEDLLNRVRKVHKHRRRWAGRQGLTAYRIYDRDIPEHPYAIDWYDGRVLVVAYPGRQARRVIDPAYLEESLRPSLAGALEVPPEEVHFRVKTPQRWGTEQYEKRAGSGRRFTVRENGLDFWVNLTDYLDTGLFLDHRNTRARVREEAQGKRFLNLFAYTGSFTVYAAAGGAASTTSVDLSNSYVAWAADNLTLNGYADRRHEVLRSDVLRWLQQNRDRRYDLVVLDPPSWSASKKMVQSFEVQRDHSALLRDTLALMSPGGVLYFSTNYREFELEPAAVAGCSTEEITPGSIPEDFRDRKVHRCFRIVAGGRP